VVACPRLRFRRGTKFIFLDDGALHRGRPIFAGLHYFVQGHRTQHGGPQRHNLSFVFSVLCFSFSSPCQDAWRGTSNPSLQSPSSMSSISWSRPKVWARGGGSSKLASWTY